MKNKSKDKPLVINKLTKTYGKFRGVDSIDIELENGEVFGFLGPNGAGKSTTIRTMLDFMTPSEGSVTILGLDSHEDSVEVKDHVGYLAGDIAMYEKMTGQKVIEHLTALGKKTDWDYVHELTEKLDASLHRPIHTLSKGNRQKIGLILAFMHKPELIVLDEPTSGLDPLVKQVFYDMVLEMKSQGKTIFVSSHDLSEVQKICDRAAFIKDGKLVSIEDIRNAKGLNLRRYVVRFDHSPKASIFNGVKNVSDAKVSGSSATVTITGSVGPFIAEIAKHSPIDLDEQETSLEDMFMHYYEKGDNQ